MGSIMNKLLHLLNKAVLIYLLEQTRTSGSERTSPTVCLQTRARLFCCWNIPDL